MEQTSGKGRGRASERALRSWAGIVEMIGGRLKRLRSQAFWVRLTQPRAILHGLAVMVAWLHSMLLKLPLLVVIIVLATIVMPELTQHATVIDPISVPRELADSGYTAEVASHRLRDAVTDFMSGVNSRMSNPDIALHGDLPKIVVPAVGISLDAIVASIRTLMHGTARARSAARSSRRTSSTGCGCGSTGAKSTPARPASRSTSPTSCSRARCRLCCSRSSRISWW